MDNSAGLYVILSIGSCIILILAASFFYWTARMRNEVEELKKQLATLLKSDTRSTAGTVVAAANVPRANLCSQCGKEGKTDDLMCVYCHTPFYN